MRRENKLRIGIFNDFHLSHSGTDIWHNWLLFDHTEQVVRRTIEILNRMSPDMVIILGDITHNGTEEQLELAKEVLSKLAMPWLIIPGNHDRESVRTGLFYKTFEKHIPDIYEEVDGIPCLFLTEYLPPIDYPKTELGQDISNKAIGKIDHQNLKYLFIFSHFPLISQLNYANKNKANYTYHYNDGEELLNRLDRLISGRIFCFSAHQHWHRIIDGYKVFHCMTASMVEYPMEARIISIENNKFTVSTIETACPRIARMSLNSAKWVYRLKNDRDFEIKNIKIIY
jgi:calcineurin-like phosphoesterase family protein